MCTPCPAPADIRNQTVCTHPDKHDSGVRCATQHVGWPSHRWGQAAALLCGHLMHLLAPRRWKWARTPLHPTRDALPGPLTTLAQQRQEPAHCLHTSPLDQLPAHLQAPDCQTHQARQMARRRAQHWVSQAQGLPAQARLRLAVAGHQAARQQPLRDAGQPAQYLALPWDQLPQVSRPRLARQQLV